MKDRRSTWIASVPLVLAWGVSAPAVAAEVEAFYSLQGEVTNVWAVSRDGEVVAGEFNLTAGQLPFRWQGGVFTELPLPAGHVSGGVRGASDDGSVIVGFSDSRAVRWDAGVVTILPSLWTNTDRATGVSADGSIVVGLASAPPPKQQAAVEWQGGTITDLGGVGRCRAHSVSANGSVAVGSCTPPLSDKLPWRWDLAGSQPLDPSPTGHAEVLAVSGDGLEAVGWETATSMPKALRWSPGSTTPTLIFGLFGGPADAISNPVEIGGPPDRVILGGNIMRLGVPESLPSILIGAGVDVSAWQGWNVKAMSDDGTVFVGTVWPAGVGTTLAGFRAVIPQKFYAPGGDWEFVACGKLPCDILLDILMGGIFETDLTQLRNDPAEWQAIGIDLASFPAALALDQTPVWRLTFDGQLAPPASVTFHYDDSTLQAGVNENDLAVFHQSSSGGAWAQLETLAHDVTANEISIETQSFSPFVLAGRLPQCSDGLDNDGDRGIDWDGGPSGGDSDLQCTGPMDDRESPSPGPRCGLGLELVPVLAILVLLRRVRRHGVPA